MNAVTRWKAPGGNGLPAMMWKQLWQAVKDSVLHLFRLSLREGNLPQQWRSAMVIQLRSCEILAADFVAVDVR